MCLICRSCHWWKAKRHSCFLTKGRSTDDNREHVWACVVLSKSSFFQLFLYYFIFQVSLKLLRTWEYNATSNLGLEPVFGSTGKETYDENLFLKFFQLSPSFYRCISSSLSGWPLVPHLGLTFFFSVSTDSTQQVFQGRALTQKQYF